jgi:polygalacturonase
MGEDQRTLAPLSGEAVVRQAEETRRAILGKAGLVAGGFGIATLARPDRALALDGPGVDREDLQFEGFNNVKDVPPTGVSPGSTTGAVGDGVADDTNAIQTWINASSGSSPVKRGVVYFPPGTYKTSSRLLLPSNTHIRGSGRLSVIKASASHTGQLMYNKDGATLTAGNDDITVENLELDGNRQARNLDQTYTAITIHAPNRGQFCNRISLKDLFIHDCRFGIGVYSWRDGEIIGCHLWELERDGIHGEQENQYVRVIGNRVSDLGDDGIAFHAAPDPSTDSAWSAHDITIVGNVCGPFKRFPGRWDGSGSGVAFSGIKNSTIMGNTILEAFSSGVRLTNANNTACENVTLEGNVIADTGKQNPSQDNPTQAHGVDIAGAYPNYSNHGSAGASRLVVKGNVVLNPRSNALLVECWTNGPVEHVLLEGNLLYWSDPVPSWVDGVGNGIVVNSWQSAAMKKVAVENNVVFNPQVQGITSQPGGSGPIEDLVIAGNQVWNAGNPNANSVMGIRVISVKDVRIVDNLATDEQSTKTQGWGLQLSSPSGSVLVLGNDFSGNRVAPTTVSGTSGADDLRIRDNIGWTPWVGEVSWTDSWAGSGPYTKEVAVTFPAAFPSAKTPAVFCTVKDLDAYAVAKNVSNTGFTLRVVSNSNPGTQQKASWVAEPQ